MPVKRLRLNARQEDEEKETMSDFADESRKAFISIDGGEYVLVRVPRSGCDRIQSTKKIIGYLGKATLKYQRSFRIRYAS